MLNRLCLTAATAIAIAIAIATGLSFGAQAYDEAPDPRMSAPGSTKHGNQGSSARAEWQKMQSRQRSLGGETAANRPNKTHTVSSGDKDESN